MPTYSKSLELSLQRAVAIADAGHHEYTTPEHLLLALTDDVEAAAVLRACNVDLEKLRSNLVSLIDSEPAEVENGRPGSSRPSAAFQRVIRRAVTHVQSTTRRKKVTAANVLVAILTERESQASAALQRTMSRYDATLYICHGISKADQLSSRRTQAASRDLSETTAAQAKVLLLNDDYTPMEFVVHVLQRVFEKDRESAERIMREAHNEGIGTCGLYPYDEARTKVSEVLDLAREQQHPLQCVLERSGQPGL